MSSKLHKVIISGGGTGGHIFPAIAIANRIKEEYPDAEILFIGAEGKMEMEKVPKSGYKIIGLHIRGLSRKLSLDLIKFPFMVLKAVSKAKKIIKDFGPDVVIGVGGYASAPTLRAANSLGIPTLIQEQNSFAGKTNKWLSKKVKKICVAYDGMEKFFPKEKIVMTGNPVRKEVVTIEGKRENGFKAFNLEPNKKTLLVIGGSLGARTINKSILAAKDSLLEKDIQIIWQCGKFYIEDYQKLVPNHPNIFLSDFIYNMDEAYACADFIVSRAGAISISELTIIGKPVILVPSPNVAEDHQTKNALALTKNNAALLVKDVDAEANLGKEILSLYQNEDQQKELSKNIKEMALDHATDLILEEIKQIV
ncbi:MAG: undecaprenyldiphospho-muramoylpentapeptide beta-N-acetylglucosaminyltransferase [Crocinitomicaceae bacterium]|nr:undecaprenyldiphospho-muramoylpentapeptide beta-N-acetylglucosaminyltransferase [Crocinitomicaceae bacterium]